MKSLVDAGVRAVGSATCGVDVLDSQIECRPSTPATARSTESQMVRAQEPMKLYGGADGRIAGPHSRRVGWPGLLQEVREVEAMIVSGKRLFALKAVLKKWDPRRKTGWLHEERACVLPHFPSIL